MKYKLPVIIVQSEEGGYIARCEEVRATATGDTPDEAVDNLREAIMYFRMLLWRVKSRLSRSPYEEISGTASA